MDSKKNARWPPSRYWTLCFDVTTSRSNPASSISRSSRAVLNGAVPGRLLTSSMINLPAVLQRQPSKSESADEPVLSAWPHCTLLRPCGPKSPSRPQLSARKPRALDQRVELRPHDARMHAAVKWSLRETAIGAGQQVLTPDQAGDPHNALGDQLRMLDHVGRVADHAGNKHPALRQLGVFPHTPLVLVPRVGAFNDIGADLHTKDEIDNILERHVGRMRARPAPPTDMIADAVGGQPGDGLVEHLDL